MSVKPTREASKPAKVELESMLAEVSENALPVSRSKTMPLKDAGFQVGLRKMVVKSKRKLLSVKSTAIWVAFSTFTVVSTAGAMPTVNVAGVAVAEPYSVAKLGMK